MLQELLLPLTEASRRDYHNLPFTDRMHFDLTPSEIDENIPQAMHFGNQFEGCMELSANRQQVIQYLDRHQDWFCRCAQPMHVKPIGNNGYSLVVGRYGSFGFEIEPQIGLHLLPQTQGVYRIETIPTTNDQSQGYWVDFQASLQLVEGPTLETNEIASDPLPQLTRVEWGLDLNVAIVFPSFIRRFPKGLIQYTGDQVLKLIVHQVSQRLMAKVQTDFHTTVRHKLT